MTILNAYEAVPEDISFDHGWFETYIPVWRNMKVAACAKCQGMMLLPKAGEEQREAPVAKFMADAFQSSSKICHWGWQLHIITHVQLRF